MHFSIFCRQSSDTGWCCYFKMICGVYTATIVNLHASFRTSNNSYFLFVQDILMLCWSYQPSERPDFIRLLKTLEKLPKKRLARSPSHPIHLSRSAESVFWVSCLNIVHVECDLTILARSYYKTYYIWSSLAVIKFSNFLSFVFNCAIWIAV